MYISEMLVSSVQNIVSGYYLLWKCCVRMVLISGVSLFVIVLYIWYDSDIVEYCMCVLNMFDMKFVMIEQKFVMYIMVSVMFSIISGVWCVCISRNIGYGDVIVSSVISLRKCVLLSFFVSYVVSGCVRNWMNVIIKR